MHMADALLSPAVGGGMYAVSVAAVAYSAKKIKKDDLGESKAPLMAVSGAMVFAAQMINFTIPGTGSSGHIGGGILLAVLLGPYAGTLALSAVLVIQCLCFADGGLLALGCNIFNMAVIPCLFIYPLIMKRILSRSPNAKRIWIGSIVSVIIALQLGAFFVVLETTVSGVAELPFTAFVLLMQPIHLAIGAVEGVVTAAILNFVFAARPQILTTNLSAAGSEYPKSGKTAGIKNIIIVFACIAAALAAGFSLLASKYPDGLEWAVQRAIGTAQPNTGGEPAGFFASIQQHLAFMPGYDTSSGTGAGTPIAGLIGAVLVFALAGAAALIILAYKKKRKNAVKPNP